MITVGTDTYVSLSYANSYVSENYVKTSAEYLNWFDSVNADREVYLRRALKTIEKCNFRGMKSYQTQTLSFPRAMRINSSYYDNYNYNPLLRPLGYNVETEVSSTVKAAQCEEAVSLCIKNKTGQTNSDRVKMQKQGLRAFKLGDLSENYGAGNKNEIIFESEEAKELLKPYLSGGFETC